METLVSYQLYRPTLELTQVLQEIWQQKGKLYDVEIVEVCLKVFQKNKFNF